MTDSSSRSGYAALASVLLISAITLSVVTSFALMSISSSQTTVEDTKQISSFTLVESCAEEALLQIRNNNTVVSSITLPQGSCTVTINSHIGAAWVFTETGTQNGYTKSIQVSATRNANVSITSWQEL